MVLTRKDIWVLFEETLGKLLHSVFTQNSVLVSEVTSVGITGAAFRALQTSAARAQMLLYKCQDCAWEVISLL